MNPQPILWIIAGPDGVGKTTHAFRHIRAVAGTARFVNLDEIARRLSSLEPAAFRARDWECPDLCPPFALSGGSMTTTAPPGRPSSKARALASPCAARSRDCRPPRPGRWQPFATAQAAE